MARAMYPGKDGDQQKDHKDGEGVGHAEFQAGCAIIELVRLKEQRAKQAEFPDAHIRCRKHGHHKGDDHNGHGDNERCSEAYKGSKQPFHDAKSSPFF